MDARNKRLAAAAALVVLTTLAPARAADGLQLGDTDAWPRWQARLGVVTAPSLTDDGAATRSLQGAQLLGDWYFTGPGFGAGRVGGGLRATSGLYAGPRGGLLGAAPMPGGSAFTLGARRAPADAAGQTGTIAYLGLGYTGVALRGGWGFSADIGLMGHGPGLRPARSTTGIDELLRDLRLTPVLQLGVSYAF